MNQFEKELLLKRLREQQYPGAVVRGDWGGIVIEDGCNVQENCTIHMFPGATVKLEKDAEGIGFTGKLSWKIKS